jgi:hypothetical protein
VICNEKRYIFSKEIATSRLRVESPGINVEQHFFLQMIAARLNYVEQYCNVFELAPSEKRFGFL